MARRVIEYSLENLRRQSIEAMIRAVYGYIEPETKKRRRSKRRASEHSVEMLREQWIEAMIKHGVGEPELRK
jgi:hypothetical protein